MNIGEVRKANEIGRRGLDKHIWHACVDCGKERWISLRHREVRYLRCRSCSAKLRSRSYGVENHNWKGGKVTREGGYIGTRLQLGDFFHSMVTNGYVLEHRLIMAKHLGRNLHSWEIVHHKNHIKNDNRIENLQLVSDDRHKQITILENKIDKLLEGQKELKNEIRLLRWENKQLNSEVKSNG